MAAGAIGVARRDGFEALRAGRAGLVRGAARRRCRNFEVSTFYFQKGSR
jgi:hypothetical protein